MDPTLLLSVLAIAVGFVLLIWGADRFIAGAAALAQDLGVPKLLVGLTVVGLGTSAPEMFVAAVAALQGKSGLAIGNAIGSNVTNIALILGVTALVTPLVLWPSGGNGDTDPSRIAAVAVVLFIGIYWKNAVAAVFGGMGALYALQFLGA